MADFLPPVVGRLVGDNTDFNAKVGQSIRQLDQVGTSAQKAGAQAKTGLAQAEAGAAGATNKVSGLRSTIGVVGGAMAAVGAVRFLGGAIRESEEATKVSAQTAAAIKSTGGAANVTAGQIGALSDSLSRKTGIDDEVIQAGSNMLLTFTNVRNEVGKGNDIFNQASAIGLDMAKALGQDATTSAMQLGKALNDPIGGVTALRRVGVQLTDQQQEQVKAFVQSGRTLDAQKLILAELGKEFGGSAAAQATAADKARVAYGNLQEGIGKALMPAMAGLIGIALPLVDVIGKIPGPLLAAGLGATGLALAVGPATKAFDGFSKIAGGIGSIIGKVGPMFLGTGAAAATSGTTAATGGIAFSVAWLPVIALIAAIGAAAFLLWKNWDTIWGFIKGIAVGAYNFVHDHMALIALAVGLPIAPLLLLWKNWDTIFGFVKGIVVGAANFVKDHIGQIAAVVLAPIAPLLLLWKNWDRVWGLIRGGLGGVRDLVGFVGEAFDRAFGVVQEVVQRVWNVIHPIFDAVKGGLGAVDDILGKIAGAGKAVGGVAGKAGGLIGKLNPFQEGGVVPGTPGTAVPIMAHAGEIVLSEAMSRAILGGRAVAAPAPVTQVTVPPPVVSTITQVTIPPPVVPIPPSPASAPSLTINMPINFSGTVMGDDRRQIAESIVVEMREALERLGLRMPLRLA